MPWYDSHIIRCGWNESGGRFRIFVSEDPSLSAEGASISEASTTLEQKLYDVAPDFDTIHPCVFEYNPPLPIPAELAMYLTPEYYIISGDGLFDGEGSFRRSKPALQTLYSGGICEVCGAGIVERTEQPLVVGYNDPVDAGFVRFLGEPGAHVFSDRFIELLTAEERTRLSFRPISLSARRSKRAYFELISLPDLTFVAVRAFDTNGFECNSCGQRRWHVDEPWVEESSPGLWYFVVREDLLLKHSELFVVGESRSVRLCMSRRRWDRMRGQLGTKGVTSRPLGLVESAGADRRPRLRLRGPKCSTCDGWPKPVGLDRKFRAIFDLTDGFWSTANYKWIAQAERGGYLRIVRQTHSLDEIDAMLDEMQRPIRPEVISFRCPDCWRLGRLVYTKNEIRFLW